MIFTVITGKKMFFARCIIINNHLKFNNNNIGINFYSDYKERCKAYNNE